MQARVSEYLVLSVTCCLLERMLKVEHRTWILAHMRVSMAFTLNREMSKPVLAVKWPKYPKSYVLQQNDRFNISQKIHLCASPLASRPSCFMKLE